MHRAEVEERSVTRLFRLPGAAGQPEEMNLLVEFVPINRAHSILDHYDSGIIDRSAANWRDRPPRVDVSVQTTECIYVTVSGAI
jgi:hypothetical protein